MDLNIKRGLKSIKAWYNKNLIFDDFPVRFIVSTGRTGTKFFEEFFNDNFQNVSAKHEPYPDLYDLSVQKFRKNLDIRETSRQLVLERSGIISALRSEGASAYIESSLYLSSLIPEIEHLFKDYKILHIVRDPRTFVVSAFNKRSMKEDTPMFHGDHDVRKRLNSDDFPLDPFFGQWEQMTRFERICWHWIKFNSLISESVQNKENYLLLKFEDIFHGNRSDSLMQIVDFFGLKDNLLTGEIQFSKKKVNQNPDKLIGNHAEWTPEQKRIFDSIINPHLEKYGYK